VIGCGAHVIDSTLYASGFAVDSVSFANARDPATGCRRPVIDASGISIAGAG
jgi:hypothetical protein